MSTCSEQAMVVIFVSVIKISGGWNFIQNIKCYVSSIIIKRRNIQNPMACRQKNRRWKLTYDSDQESRDVDSKLQAVKDVLLNLSKVSHLENGQKDHQKEEMTVKEQKIKSSGKKKVSILFESRSDQMQKQQKPDGGIDSARESLCEGEFKTTLQTLKTREFKRSLYRNISEPFQSQFKRIRIGQLCKNIRLKMIRNNVFRVPKNEQDLQKFQKKKSIDRIKIPENISLFLDGFFIFIIIWVVLLLSVIVSFTHFTQTPNAKEQEDLFIVFFINFLLEMIAKFVFNISQEKISSLSLEEHAYSYLRGSFGLDLAVVVLIFLRVISEDQSLLDILILIAIPTKIPELLKKINRLQKKFMTNMAYQKYASIVKIILFNFVFAHFIAVCLSLMTQINPHDNWQVNRGIHEKWWFERYVWSYYWATTIMLTIGFGDITPKTYEEAICIIFIEIVSCIAFSYNISCLGSILAAIQSKNEKVDNNRKLFNYIASKNNFSNGLVKKIEDFIEDQAELKERFYIEEEKEFVQSLPDGYKKELVCESNINMLKGLPFFGPLFKSSIYKLSQHIVKKIYTPQEIISTPHSEYSFKILQTGSISYFCNEKNRRFSCQTINKVERTQLEKPFLMDLQVISLQHHKYSIKSLVYSIVHKLHIDDFLRVLKEIPKDYEYYCFLKDQSKHKIDQYETVDCKECRSKHTYFDCPLYHYMPIKSEILTKHLNSVKIGSNTGCKDFQRQEKIRFKPLRSFKANAFDIKISESSLIQNKEYPKYDSIYQGLKIQVNNTSIMEKILYLSQSGDEQASSDEVWDLNLDTIRSYDMYFPSSNIKKVGQRLNKLREEANPFVRTLEYINL